MNLNPARYISLKSADAVSIEMTGTDTCVFTLKQFDSNTGQRIADITDSFSYSKLKTRIQHLQNELAGLIAIDADASILKTDFDIAEIAKAAEAAKAAETAKAAKAAEAKKSIEQEPS